VSGEAAGRVAADLDAPDQAAADRIAAGQDFPDDDLLDGILLGADGAAGFPYTEEDYAGPAVLIGSAAAGGGEARIPVRARLSGHVEPHDGRFRWYGRLEPDPRVTELHGTGRNRVVLALPSGAELPCLLAELNPWGGARLTGTGRGTRAAGPLPPSS
jgi:hypothetical protein